MNSSNSTQPFLFWCNFIPTLLSIVGSAWMSLLCLKTPPPKSAALKLILGIALSDLLYSLCNLMSAFDFESDNVLCKVEGFIREFSAMLTIFFSTATALLCYFDTTIGGGFQQTEFFRKSLLVSLALAFILGVTPLLSSDVTYKRLQLFCWVGSPQEDPSLFSNLIILMIYWGVPLIVALITSFAGYLKAIKNITNFAQIYLAEVDIKVYKLLWYPFVLLLIFMPSLIDNILAFCFSFSNPTWVQAIHLILTHSIGFVNALVYGLQRPKSGRKVQDCQISMHERSRNNSVDRENRSNSLTDDLIRASTIMESSFEVY